jgi:uncharacterized protein YoxC
MIITYLTLTGVILAFVSIVIGFMQTRKKVAEVHVLVNSRLTSVMSRVNQLVGVLEQHDIDVPPDPNKAAE